MQKETIFIKNRYGLRLSIRITTPTHTHKPLKLAFIEHGLFGNKDESHMVILEEELSKRGYRVVNLDASNSLNESDFSADGTTFSGHYTDLEDVIEWAHSQSWFMEPFALAGHSMGAAAVLLYAQNYPDRVNLLLPLSFPWLSAESKKAQSDSQEMITWKERGYFDKVSKSRGKTLRVPYHFMENLAQYDFAKNADRIIAKTILIIGDQENERRLDDNRELFNILTSEKEFILLPDTPHAIAKTHQNAETFRKALGNLLEITT